MKKIFYLLTVLILMVSCDPVPNIKEMDKKTEIPYYITTVLKDSSNIETMRYVENKEKMYVINKEKEIIKIIDKETNYDTLVLIFFFMGIFLGVLISVWAYNHY